MGQASQLPLPTPPPPPPPPPGGSQGTPARFAVMQCRLTKQVSAFYDDVLRLLSAAPLSQHFDKSWTSHVQVKATLYDVESQLQQAAQLHKDDDIAPEIARLKVTPALVQLMQHELHRQLCGAVSCEQSCAPFSDGQACVCFDRQADLQAVSAAEG